MENELKQVLEWLKSSKEDMTGETATNVLFLIAHLEKLLSKSHYQV